MAIDWSEFKDGDRVRVVFEGPLDLKRDPHGRPIFYAGSGWEFWGEGILNAATSAELIERPFKAPEAGKLLRGRLSGEEILCMSYGADGYRELRINGQACGFLDLLEWQDATAEWRDSIEVLDV